MTAKGMYLSIAANPAPGLEQLHGSLSPAFEQFSVQCSVQLSN